jgi:GNAT superfamily N-acetyltransferase
MIRYTTETADLRAEQLRGGFFVGWPDPPSPEAHLRILQGSARVVLAYDDDQVVGFVTAVSDGVCSAYLPLLEVLPGWQRRGIGAELVRRMLAELEHLYMVDLCCDPGLVPFYERLGLRPAHAMIRRLYDRQSCR